MAAAKGEEAKGEAKGEVDWIWTGRRQGRSRRPLGVGEGELERGR